jgi:NTE family protein
MSQTSTSPHKPVSLALQGGGTHGAFTWGVLDALLERGLPMAALSGASAGAINAVVMAHGLAEGGTRDGPERARQALERFWLATAKSLPAVAHVPGAQPGEPPKIAPLTQAMLQWTRWFTPTQLNPFDINPLRRLLDAQIDFERLRQAAGPALFIATTLADTGQLRVFSRGELSLDTLLASACLPTLAHPVWIDGRAHWDGAFSANPALAPLLWQTTADDLMLVTLSPLSPVPLPQSAEGIQARMTDIALNATFLREARALAEWQAQAQARWMRWGSDRRLARLRWHLVAGDAALAHLPGHTRLLPEVQFVQALRDRGREHAAAWWDEHSTSLGRRSSFDPLAVFGQAAA